MARSSWFYQRGTQWASIVHRDCKAGRKPKIEARPGPSSEVPVTALSELPGVPATAVAAAKLRCTPDNLDAQAEERARHADEHRSSLSALLPLQAPAQGASRARSLPGCGQPASASWHLGPPLGARTRACFRGAKKHSAAVNGIRLIRRPHSQRPSLPRPRCRLLW